MDWHSHNTQDWAFRDVPVLSPVLYKEPLFEQNFSMQNTDERNLQQK